MKSIYVENLVENVGAKIEECFFISNLQPNYNRQGTEWINVQLSDRTGEVRAKIWSEYDDEKIMLCQNHVCKITGKVDIYNGVAGCAITEISVLKEGEYELSDYVYSMPENLVSSYADELRSYISMVEDKALKRLLNTIFCEGNIKTMCELPAGIMNHHAFNGALLVHTLEVVQIALAAADVHDRFMEVKGYVRDKVNRDLLISGALLHDIGKIIEYRPFPFAKRTKMGRLTGHLADGAMLVTSYNSSIPKAERVQDTSELNHIILSSHGEFGGMRPATVEAVIVHNADMTSASMDGYDNAFLEYAKKHPGDDAEYVWSNMLQTKVYREKK